MLTQRSLSPRHTRLGPAPALAGLGCAVPPLVWRQDDIASQLARLWKLGGSELARWERIMRGSGIESRHGVCEPEAVMRRSTAERMRLFEDHAPALALRAAQAALRHAAISPRFITDLVVVTCTGFSAPGLDVNLVESLGLSPTVRRSQIGFMGCFGAITGLRAAAGAASISRGVTLLVCVELCSLHLRPDATPDNQVASALFGDGAAAAVVRADEKGGQEAMIGRILPGRSLLLPEGREDMSWRITDQGFAMTLSKQVPNRLGSAVQEVLGKRPGALVVHPGGPQILDAVERACSLEPPGVAPAREVLRRFGNMSSATVLFVLQDVIARGAPPPYTLLAFGPGLSLECLPLHPPNKKRRPNGRRS
jgi:predicted naringenin-chalcone synthase